MIQFFRRLARTRGFSKLVDNAEDPEVILENYVKNVWNEVSETEIATSKMIAEEKRLLKQLNEVKLKLQKREEQALNAVEIGNEELALRYIEDKAKVKKEIEFLEVVHEKTESKLRELKSTLKQMKLEYQDLEFKLNAIKHKTGPIALSNKKELHSLDNEDNLELERLKEIIKKKNGRDK
ncbi:PspA/IM30 family protein [Evansella sp. AB-P1]|uniref:PspA/IM30 family protein n=1 Tax=Evansella sp. AB-P1 TaxID=3037653 RepID=UPI00241DB85C|nr:PspA/IM30 family protein [Evansella sp. AB-P1]MDG5787898.1 PspA/IM30 family protein [Evansella sp. AB-P1]